MSTVEEKIIEIIEKEIGCLSEGKVHQVAKRICQELGLSHAVLIDSVECSSSAAEKIP